jgi:hypothetical protein
MSNGTSRPLGTPQKKERKASAIVDRSSLRRQRGAVERWSALVVLLISFAGTIATFAGGWLTLIEGARAGEPSWAAIIGGIAFQGLLTYVQWHYYDRRALSWISRGIDTALTAIGYGPLVVVALAGWIASRGVEAPTNLQFAWGVIVLVSFLAAWYPESRLVD